MSARAFSLSTGGPGTRTIAIALSAALPLAGIALAEPKPALAALGVAGALAAVAVVLVVAPGRAPDALLLGALACMALPIDKYFGYREHVGGWPGYRVSISDLALLAALPSAAIGWYLGRIRNRLPGPLLAVYGALLGQYVLSLVNAPRKDLSSLEILAAVHALATAAAVAALFRRDLLRAALALIAAQVVVHSGFAVAQAVTGRQVGAGWFKGAQIVRETLETGAVRFRPSGLFDHPIVYADMLMLSLPLLFAGLFLEGGRLWRAGIAAAMAAGLAGLALTLSRGAWIATAVAAVTLGCLAVTYRLATWRALRRAAVGALMAGLLTVPPFLPRIYERLTESNEGNLRVRFELNGIAARMIAAHPLTGVGVSNFMPAMERYDPRNVMRYFPATVHNLYLLEASEAGLPGLSLFLGLFLAIFLAGLSGLRRTPDEGARWVAAAVLAGLTGFLVSQLADFSHRLEPLRSVLWADIGLMFALVRRSPDARGGVR